MDCEKIKELLSSYVEEELGEEEKLRFESHLESCKDCKSLLFSWREIKESLADFPEFEVSEELLSSLYSLPERKKKLSHLGDFFLHSSLQPILASAVILLTLVSFYFFNPERALISKSLSRNFHLGYSKVERLCVRAASLTGYVSGYKDYLFASLKNIAPFAEKEQENKIKMED